MVVGKVAVHLCLTLIIKELKFSVEQSRVVAILNNTKYHILCTASLFSKRKFGGVCTP